VELRPLLITKTKLHFARFEFKYILPLELRDEVERELRFFLEFDPFVKAAPHHQYFVRSLYYDDPDFTCFHDKHDGLHTRWKFRVRTYTDNPGDGTPYFLEIKGRYNNLVFKHRAPVEAKPGEMVIRGAELSDHLLRHVPDGQFGDYVFDGMKVKELFRIEGPLGSYYLREDSDRPIIMMGGGTGFAPLKGMLEHAFHIKLNRPIHLFCGVRARKDLYMDDMVKDWLKEHDNLKYTPVLSDPAAGDNWQGKTGFVHEAIIEEYPDLSGYDVYMSGPPPMIKAGMDTFYAHGLPESQIYSDSFEYSDDALRSMGITKPQA